MKRTITVMEEQMKKNLEEIKAEFWRLANDILLDDTVDDVDELIKITKILESLKKKAADSSSGNSFPVEFRCRISKAPIQDPVIIVTGCTYDRPFIEKYLSEGNEICPESQKEITDTKLIISNHLAELESISNWCKRNGVDYPIPASQARIDSLILNLFSCPLPEKKSAVKDLVNLTKRPENHALFTIRKEAIAIVLHILLPLVNLILAPDSEFHADLVTLTLNLSVIADFKKIIGEHALVIPFLIESLRRGPIQAKTRSASALANLSDLDSNINRIVKSGASEALIQLLREAKIPRLISDVASAFAKLCAHRNFLETARIDGLHRIALQKMKDHEEFVEKMLAVLNLFSENYDVLDELRELEEAPVLVRVVKDLEEAGSTEENAVALLFGMCELDGSLLDLIRGDCDAKEAINAVAVTGSPRAMAMAIGILDMMQGFAPPVEIVWSSTWSTVWSKLISAFHFYN